MLRPPRSVQRPAIYLLKHLGNALRIALDDALSSTGMTPSQVAVLSVLHSEPELSNADLARLAFVQPQSMVPLLKSLEDRGLIVRQPNPAGGRSQPARLTPEGTEHLKIGWTAAKTVEERMLTGLTKTERARFSTVLESCLASLGPRSVER